MTDNKLTEKDLSDALKNDEFLFFYQPILSLRTGRIDRSEALIRWQKDEGDLIPAGDFIPYAEQTGFITEITKAMLPRFIEDQKKILQADNTIVSSLNISADDIMQESFGTLLLELVGDSGIDPTRINIELTESSAFDLSIRSIHEIAELKANHIEFSLDDFGTGYATFEKLKNLPFTNLKIDYLFVHNAMTTLDDITLLDHSINLSHQLELNSIAEGVESETILRYLMGIGCEHAQGYHISKPLDLSSFIELIDNKPVWDIAYHGHIYKSMIDFIDWIRKVAFSLSTESGNVRSTAFQAEETPTGKFLNEVTGDVDIDLYEKLQTEHKNVIEFANMMQNAKRSGDQSLVDKLLPDFLQKCRTVNDSLQSIYNKEVQHDLLKKAQPNKALQPGAPADAKKRRG